MLLLPFRQTARSGVAVAAVAAGAAMWKGGTQRVARGTTQMLGRIMFGQLIPVLAVRFVSQLVYTQAETDSLDGLKGVFHTLDALLAAQSKILFPMLAYILKTFVVYLSFYVQNFRPLPLSAAVRP